jgi:hypothetical protein
MKIMRCAMTAVAMIGSVPVLVVAVPANGENLKMAQVDLQVGPRRDRDWDNQYRYGRERDSGVTIGIGPRGARAQHCRTVTTHIRRSDGREITRRERRCD